MEIHLRFPTVSQELFLYTTLNQHPSHFEPLIGQLRTWPVRYNEKLYVAASGQMLAVTGDKIIFVINMEEKT